MSLLNIRIDKIRQQRAKKVMHTYKEVDVIDRHPLDLKTQAAKGLGR